MNHIYLYDADCEDFTNLGYGPIAAIDAVFSETGNGDSSLTVEVAYDERGVWAFIQPEMILAAYVPVRMTPDLDGGKIITGVEKWRIKETASKTQRVMYTTKTGNEKKDKIPKGTEVTVVKKPTDSKRYKIKASKYGTGWIDSDALEYVVNVTLPDDSAGIETAETPWVISKQLFRIYNYIRNESSITVEARHITYDLLGHITQYYEKGAADAQTALNAILANTLTEHPFSLQSNIGGTRTGVDWRYINPISAIMDPEKGFIARWGGYLVRDNYEMSILAEVSTDRGIEIAYGKNLQGVEVQTDYSDVVTAILPLGRTESGAYLRLTDDGSDDLVPVSDASSAIDRIYVLDCASDATVSDSVSINLARQRMREAANQLIASGVHLPAISMTVDFLQIGDTDEYSQFRNLERLFLYDWVRVSLVNKGIEAFMQVSGIEYDPIRQRFIKTYLGDGIVSLTTLRLSSFQVPNGLDGYKILPGTIGGGHLIDDAINARHIQANSIATRNLQAESVTAEKISAGAIEAKLVEAETIIAELLKAEKITGNMIEAKSITTENIAANSITTQELAAAAITAEKIASKTITAEQLMANLITANSGLIAVGAIQTAQIADGSITSAKIVELDADVIKTGTLSVDRLLLKGENGLFYKINAEAAGLTATQLTQDQYKNLINGTVIVAKSITAAQIAAQTITANEIAANAITAAKINVADLFASQATINAINAMDIRGNSYLKLMVDDIHVGGRNLFEKSVDTGSYIVGWYSSPTISIGHGEDASVPSGSYISFTMSTASGTTYNGGPYINLDNAAPKMRNGETYTISAWVWCSTAKSTGVMGAEFMSSTTAASRPALAARTWTRHVVTGVYSASNPMVVNFYYGSQWKNGDEFRVSSIQIEHGNKVTDWGQAPEELIVGTTVEITKDRFRVTSPSSEFAIPGTEDGSAMVRIDEAGLYSENINGPVVKTFEGGVFDIIPGGLYGTLQEAFDAMEGKSLTGDVTLRLYENDKTPYTLRGVSGPGRILITTRNMLGLISRGKFSAQGNASVTYTDDTYQAIVVSSSTTGTWQGANLEVGHVGALGLRGRRIRFRGYAATHAESTTTAWCDVAIYAGGRLLGEAPRPSSGAPTDGLFIQAVVTVPEDLKDEDTLNLLFHISGGTSLRAGTKAQYAYITLEVDDGGSYAYADLAGRAAEVRLSIENCTAQVAMNMLDFAGRVSARYSNVSLHQCLLAQITDENNKASGGFFLWGGSGAMYNCRGNSALTTAASARGGGVIEIVGSAPGGALVGMIDKDRMTNTSTGGSTPSMTYTKTFNATATGTYSGNAWWTSDAGIRQGRTSGAGNLRGAMIFDLSSLSGKRVSKAVLKLKRVEGYGKGADVDVFIYRTNITSLSGAPSKYNNTSVTGKMGPGDVKSFDVTNILRSDNPVKAFVLEASDTELMAGKTYSDNYARFAGTGNEKYMPQLTVTYT